MGPSRVGRPGSERVIIERSSSLDHSLDRAAAEAAPPAPVTSRQARRQAAASRRRRRRRHLVVLAAAALLAPVVYSYVTTMMRPSSLPLGIRSVEWVRAHHGAPLVDTAERWWYSRKAPKPGGPALTTLPSVGHAPTPTSPAPSPRRRVEASFRPRAITPLIRPVLTGEGRWHSVGPAVLGSPPVLVATFRTDPVYPRIVGYVAWIDHTRTRLALYPGRYEPPNAVPRGPMEVPLGLRRGLLATFNSGFTYGDAHGGFAIDGHVATPLRPGMGTVVAYRNGRVDVIAWKGGATPPHSIVLARQNLPLILDGGRPNSNLSDSSRWGATLGNAVRVWRSGVGVDRRGNLVYAAADYQTVGTLAAILRHAGAVRAVELDINAEWPSFITYGLAGARDPTKLVPNYQQSATRYLVPDDRDFFAVFRRSATRSRSR